MSANPVIESGTQQQSDRLLWLAGGVVVALGVTWLLISQPWSSSTVSDAPSVPAAVQTTPDIAPAGAPVVAPTSAASVPPQPELGSSLNNPLRMAQLAYDAGMLIEPEDYSAWTLFARVLEEEPGNGIAQEGLQKVAADLVQRGTVALEQGRYADVSATVDRVLGKLPEHSGANELAARLEALQPKAPEPVAAPEPEAARAAVAEPAAPAVAEPRPEPKVDPVVVAHEAFERALRDNRVLTPADDSARHYVGIMIQAQPSHELTRKDQDLLVTELLARSSQALEALDTEGARAWIDAAEPIAADQAPIVAARDAWLQRLIAMESAKPLPASALTVRTYVPPNYPRAAATRGTEGWVDLEFTVAADGSTRDVTVADASHERTFREEAIAAVAQWRFEPRVFMDRPIDQRTYTRVRFLLAE
jgi:TonB family protein